MEAWAQGKHPGVDLRSETAKFLDHEFDKPKSDWPAAWRNWIARAKQFDAGRVAGARPRTATNHFTDINYAEGLSHDGIVQG